MEALGVSKLVAIIVLFLVARTRGTEFLWDSGWRAGSLHHWTEQGLLSCCVKVRLLLPGLLLGAGSSRPFSVKLFDPHRGETVITSELRRQNCLEVAPRPRLFQLSNQSHRLQEKLVFFLISPSSLETWYYMLVYITLILCLLVVGA